MDMYEQLVEVYLTVHERRAVIPQFPVLFDERGEPWTEGRKVGWSAYPDFLAVSFGANHGAQVIEVSKSMSPDKPKDLVKRTANERQRIEQYVRWFVRNDAVEIQWRFFVRDRHVKALRNALNSAQIPSDVKALEEVVDWVKNVMP
jgi:hypothetical protein